MARLWLSDWWRRGQAGPWRIVAEVVEADQIPDFIPTHGAIRVGSARSAKWLVFDCPCGKGHRVMLNLDNRRRPAWQVLEASPLSVWPSVDADAGQQRCHYVIGRGRIFWARPDKRTVRPLPDAEK